MSRRRRRGAHQHVVIAAGVSLSAPVWAFGPSWDDRHCRPLRHLPDREDETILWVSGALPGSVHDKRAEAT